MLNLAQFYIRGPEFATDAGNAAADARVQAALDAAAARTDADVFGANENEAHFYLTAHLLSTWPGGKPARIRGEGFGTLYLTERMRLEALCAPVLGALLADE